MKFFCLFILVFITQFTYAQCDDSLLFTESEKESFVQVYLKVKKQKLPLQDELLYELANKNNISAKHFQKIMHPSRKKKSFTENEKAFFAEIQVLERDYKSTLENTERKECKSYKLDYEDYSVMQAQYRSCMRFQRSVSEYIKRWK